MTLSSDKAVETSARQWKQYPEYRDSGVEWLGEIPEHWVVSRIKEHVSSLVEKSPDAERPLVALEHIRSGSGSLVEDYEPEAVVAGDRMLFEEGDVLFGKLRPYLRKYWMAEFPGCCPTEFLVLRSWDSSLTKRFI